MSKLIYFVDDDKMILNLLEYTFSGMNNYKVKTFLSGEGCLSAISERPDLIVLDHSFIVDNSEFTKGIEILKKIREVNSKVPVILLSGEKNENVINEYNQSGIKNFITKDSFFIDSLMNSIKDIFNQNKGNNN